MSHSGIDGDKPFFTYAFIGRRQVRLDRASIGREHAFKRPLVVRTGFKEVDR
jgi:hypothetical protein